MASDRHGKHNKPTIAFRVTPYEQQVINERVKASGMKKRAMRMPGMDGMTGGGFPGF